ncbi:MAG TPA: addiction module protein [Rhodocyclaceae bacterium]|nr:addiction module protein [Rhodocyclaceae bacterium]
MNISAVDIATLPIAEKVRLMEALWDSFSKDADDRALTPDWHRQVLDRRAARLAAGEEPVSAWDAAKNRLRAGTK